MAADGEITMKESCTSKLLEQNYDIFLACPMSAYKGEQYTHMRNTVISIVQRIRKQDKKSRIFCPAIEINDLKSWDLPQSALEEDLAALERSELFVMIYTRPIPAKVSSVIVEAGMALAHRIPTLMVVNDRQDMPYLLRGADQLKSATSRHGFGDFSSFDTFQVKILELQEGQPLVEPVHSEISQFRSGYNQAHFSS